MDMEGERTQETETVPATPVEKAPSSIAGQGTAQATAQKPIKFCSHCGGSIDAQAVICPLCGCQVEQMAAAAPNIVINNANNNTNTQVQKQTSPIIVAGRPKNKWVAVLLCLFLGLLGGHKFYEGKVGMGILYFFTGGLCGIGAVVDIISLLFKPNPYYV